MQNLQLTSVRDMWIIVVNLALADEAVTVVCIPLVIGQTLFKLWIYGDVLCKLSGFMQGARFFL